jgi:hypothetical protein
MPLPAKISIFSAVNNEGVQLGENPITSICRTKSMPLPSTILISPNTLMPTDPVVVPAQAIPASVAVQTDAVVVPAQAIPASVTVQTSLVNNPIAPSTASVVLPVIGSAIGSITIGYAFSKFGKTIGKTIGEVTVSEEWVDTMAGLGERSGALLGAGIGTETGRFVGNKLGNWYDASSATTLTTGVNTAVAGTIIGGTIGGYLGSKTGKIIGRKIGEFTVSEEWIATIAELSELSGGIAGTAIGGWAGIKLVPLCYSNLALCGAAVGGVVLVTGIYYYTTNTKESNTKEEIVKQFIKIPQQVIPQEAFEGRDALTKEKYDVCYENLRNSESEKKEIEKGKEEIFRKLMDNNHEIYEQNKKLQQQYEELQKIYAALQGRVELQDHYNECIETPLKLQLEYDHISNKMIVIGSYDLSLSGNE